MFSKPKSHLFRMVGEEHAEKAPETPDDVVVFANFSLLIPILAAFQTRNFGAHLVLLLLLSTSLVHHAGNYKWWWVGALDRFICKSVPLVFFLQADSVEALAVVLIGTATLAILYYSNVTNSWPRAHAFIPLLTAAGTTALLLTDY